MQIKRLDHVNIRTTQLDVMIDWYTTIPGLRSGDRPDFSFPGAWMYAGDTAVVHLISIEDAPGTGSEKPLKLEHFAFTASGIASFEAKLLENHEPFKRVDFLEMNLVQFNLWDPDKNHIHIDFNAND